MRKGTEKEKLELCDAAIERYGNIDNILVQTAVNDAVAVKRRLEEKLKAEK